MNDNVVDTHCLIRRPSKKTVAAEQLFIHSTLHVSALYPTKHDDVPKHIACCKRDMSFNKV